MQLFLQYQNRSILQGVCHFVTLLEVVLTVQCLMNEGQDVGTWPSALPAHRECGLIVTGKGTFPRRPGNSVPSCVVS